MANRLFGSLQVDSSKARDLLGWQRVVTVDEQLAKMFKLVGRGACCRTEVRPTGLFI